jgi:hypothetical protein
MCDRLPCLCTAGGEWPLSNLLLLSYFDVLYVEFGFRIWVDAITANKLARMSYKILQ